MTNKVMVSRTNTLYVLNYVPLSKERDKREKRKHPKKKKKLNIVALHEIPYDTSIERKKKD